MKPKNNAVVKKKIKKRRRKRRREEKRSWVSLGTFSIFTFVHSQSAAEGGPDSTSAPRIFFCDSTC